METYIARSKKEFLRITQLLCALNVKWVNKCGWNIEIQTNPTAATPELHSKLTQAVTALEFALDTLSANCSEQEDDYAQIQTVFKGLEEFSTYERN